MNQVTILPNDTNTFTANGVTYTFEEELSIERYRMFRSLQIAAGFGMSFEGVQDVLRKNVELLERFAQGEKVYGEMTALNYNALRGVTDIMAKESPCVWLCTNFFNSPDENRRTFDAEVMRTKIKNWQAEGINERFFINRACAMIINFNRLYDEITQLSLGWTTDELQAASEEATALTSQPTPQ